VSVLRGIPMDGRLYTLVRDAALASLASLRFRTHVRPHVSKQWLVIWDGSPLHNGQVRTLLAAGGTKQLHVEPRPPYAPDLNPGEGGWPQWKHVARRHLGGVNRVPLRCALGLARKRLRRKPHVMTACFAQAGLSMET
jgi:transposase